MIRLARRISAAVVAVLDVLFPGPVDDTMALAVAAGVVPAAEASQMPYVEQLIDWHAHPSHRPELSDTDLGQLIDLWGSESK